MTTPNKSFVTGGINKSFLTPCRRLGLSKKFRTPNGIDKLLSSPIVTPKKDAMKTHQSVVDTSTPLKKLTDSSIECKKLNFNTNTPDKNDDSTPRKHVGLYKKKKRQKLLVDQEEEIKNTNEESKKFSNKKRENENFDVPLQKDNAELKTTNLTESTEVHNKELERHKDVSMQSVSIDEQENIIKKNKTNKKTKRSKRLKSIEEIVNVSENEAKSEQMSIKEINLPIVDCKDESDSSSDEEINLATLKNHMNKQNSYDKKLGNLNKEITTKTVNLKEVSIIIDKFDKIPKDKVNKTMEILSEKELTDSEDDFVSFKKKKTHNVIRSEGSIKSIKLLKKSSINSVKSNSTNSPIKKKSMKRSSMQSKISSTYLSDSEDDFIATPKRLKSDVSMNSIPELNSSQTKVLSFGKFHIESPQVAVDEELLRNQVYELFERIAIKNKKLDDLKRAIMYKKMHNLKELGEVTLKWKKGCKDALLALLVKLNENMPISMEKLMQNINVPNDQFSYDSENGCFKD